MLMTKTLGRKQYGIGGALVVLSAIGLYGLLPRFGEFHNSLPIVSRAEPWLVAAAAAASIASVVFSAMVYQVLSMRRLQFGSTLLVQLAGLFVNRIVPAGMGGLGLNFLYLRKHSHTIVRASSVVALNNGVGFMGHLLLALGMFTLVPHAVARADVPGSWLWAGVLGGAVLAAMVFAVRRWRPALFRTFRKVAAYYTQRPARLLQAVGLSFLLTLSNVVSLWLCCLALAVSVSFLAVFVVFTFGIALGTVTPTPGGLGGVEAALVGAFVLQGVSPALALAVALLYRLVSYWFGLFLGAAALIEVNRRKLLI